MRRRIEVSDEVWAEGEVEGRKRGAKWRRGREGEDEEKKSVATKERILEVSKEVKTR